MRSEDQWELVGYCIHCNSPIFKMGEEIKFTGKDCSCQLDEEELEDES